MPWLQPVELQRPTDTGIVGVVAWCCCLPCLQDVLEVVTLGELLPQLAYHLQTCLHRQQW